MPCEKCEQKLRKLPTPNVGDSSSRYSGANKLLQYNSSKHKFDSQKRKCKECNSQLHTEGKYCPVCAYKLGKCHLCGKTVTDVSSHNMSLV